MGKAAGEGVFYLSFFEIGLLGMKKEGIEVFYLERTFKGECGGSRESKETERYETRFPQGVHNMLFPESSLFSIRAWTGFSP